MPLRRHLPPIDRPFTPVSPSNLEPLTSRFQQVSLAELAYINEHLSRNDTHHKSGWSTPLTSSAAGQRSGDDYFSAFDEEDDKRAEIRADAERPFPVDREVLKELINTHMHSSVVRMQFLSSGTFHKAFLVLLNDGREIVARIARRFMPRLKTESEVATINYLRLHTLIPVPTIYHWDANPYNRLGHEYIIMSKAPGVPLHRVFHRLKDDELDALLRNLATLIVSLSTHRFSHVGSLYQKQRSLTGEASSRASSSSPAPPFPPGMRTVPVPPLPMPVSGIGSPSVTHPPLPSSRAPIHGRTLSHSKLHTPAQLQITATSAELHHTVPTPTTETPDVDDVDFFIGPIVSWPFFGDGRGELDSPSELDRGPWPSEQAYLEACARREVVAVQREGSGVERGHRPHLPPRDRVRMATTVSTSTPGGGMNSRNRSRTGTAVHSVRGGPHAVHIGPSSQYFTGDVSGSGSGNASPGAANDANDSDSVISTESSSTSSEASSDEEAFYRDYRVNLRSSLLVAQHAARLQAVEDDMNKFMRYMNYELGIVQKELVGTVEQDGGFTLHAHDLSLANIFVDEEEHSKITCIIDWESSTIRPLWHTAHLPTFLQPAPTHAHHAGHAPHSQSAHQSHSHNPSELGDIFRRHVGCMGSPSKVWLTAERVGTQARDLHRFLEWDGWEEGLLDSVLGKERLEELEAATKPRAVGSTMGAGSSGNRDGRGNGTFKMRNGFIGLSLT